MRFPLIITALIVCSSDCFRVRPKPVASPKIWLKSYMEQDGRVPTPGNDEFRNSDAYEDLFVSKNGSEYVIMSGTRMVRFACEADYPITWKLSNPEQFSGVTFLNIRVRTERSSSFDKNLAHPQNSKFVAYLDIINGDVYQAKLSESGDLACQSVENPKTQSTIYVYTEGQLPMDFVGEVIHVNVSASSTTVIIPCRPVVPSVSISLFKRTVTVLTGLRIQPRNVTSWNQMYPNIPYIKFDPRVGFIMDKNFMRDIYGLYKCAVDGEEDTVFTFVELAVGTVPSYDFIPRKIISSRPAKLTIGPTSVKCCSDDPTLPASGDSYTCSNEAECNLLKPVFMHDVLSGRRKQQQKIFFDGPIGGSHQSLSKRKDCYQVYLQYYQTGQSKLMLCNGSGIDVVAQFIAGYEDNNNSILSSNFYPYRGRTGQPQLPQIFDLSQNNMTIANKISFENSASGMNLYAYQHIGRNGVYYDNYLMGDPGFYGGGITIQNRLLRRRRPRYRPVLREYLFEGEILHLNCKTHPFFYANGGWLRLNWKNGSTTVFRKVNVSDVLIKRMNATEEENWANQYIQVVMPMPLYSGGYRDSGDFISVVIPAVKQEMKSVDCFAPVWNSNEWDMHTFKINVKVADLPVIENSTVEESIVVKMNQTGIQLNCTLKQTNQSRLVQSYLSWEKDGKRLEYYQNGIGSIVNGFNGNATISTVSLFNVSHVTQGEYHCVAKNIAGETRKVYKIFVDDGSGGGGVVIVIFGICISLLVGVVGALIWRHWHLRKNISQILSR